MHQRFLRLPIIRLIFFALAPMAFATISASPLCAAPPASSHAGEVTISLDRWAAIQREILERSQPPTPPADFAITQRSIEATFDRGLIRGRIIVDFEAFDANVAVPLLGADASLEKIDVDGQPSPAPRDGQYYRVRVAQAGFHRASIDFALGRQELRFSRSFLIPIPSAPISTLRLTLPEPDLEVAIDGGIILEQRTSPNSKTTFVSAAFDSRPALTVAWQRTSSHEANETREMEVSNQMLVRVGEDTLQTTTLLRFKMLSGETDRLDIELPPSIEIGEVKGDLVLQWYLKMRENQERRLVVLLRHLVDDTASIVVHGQTAKREDLGTRVPFLSVEHSSLRSGFVVIEGHPSFHVTIAEDTGAEAAGMRDVPDELRSISDRPILFAYEYTKPWPTIEIASARNREIELTQAVIDDLQASTVKTAIGTEITKLRMSIRNNTRQHLSVMLPRNAVITHALIDGIPFHPAVADAHDNGDDAHDNHDPTGNGSTEALTRVLIPLRQSQRFEASEHRVHVVRPHETLSTIAMLHYHSTDAWTEIAAINGLSPYESITVGQTLRLPRKIGSKSFEESSFVVELAYKAPNSPLAIVGHSTTDLPKMDLPIMEVTWHYYLPTDLVPLAFSSNLTQLDAVRYDPIEKILLFLEAVVSTRSAWAGGMPQGSGNRKDGVYQNILRSRRTLYALEQKQQVTEALASFPFVGERYRFQRLLLGEDNPRIEVSYANTHVVDFARWFALLTMTAMTWVITRTFMRHGVRVGVRSRAFVVSSVTFVLLAVLSQWVVGVLRDMLLGFNIGLILYIVSTVDLKRLSSLIKPARRPVVNAHDPIDTRSGANLNANADADADADANANADVNARANADANADAGIAAGAARFGALVVSILSFRFFSRLLVVIGMLSVVLLFPLLTTTVGGISLVALVVSRREVFRA
ncbi:MAG: LysM peptidoglycan-binding domain-containing protein [Deltaproteobacteria bacterium]|nr:LysM peptidoglycan-binding domain-containing protein [Deltaproteobacteria bacterium]